MMIDELPRALALVGMPGAGKTLCAKHLEAQGYFQFRFGGIVVNERVHRSILDVPISDRWMHAYTYSGHPTCCAVGLANLRIMVEEKLADRAAVMGERMLNGLKAYSDHPIVGDVRGIGLMAAVAWTLGRDAIVDWFTVLLSVAAAILLLKFKVNSAWLVIGGGLLGLGYRVIT